MKSYGMDFGWFLLFIKLSLQLYKLSFKGDSISKLR